MRARQEKQPHIIEQAKSLDHVPWCEEYEKMISGMLYDPFVPPLEKARFDARKLAHKFNNHFLDSCESVEELAEGREKILKQLFGRLGKGVYFEPPLFVDYGCNISVGDGFYANANTIILDCSLVTIAARCMFGPSVSIYGATHETSVQSRRAGVEYAREVHIGDDCWIGGNTVIVAGVTIGQGCTIGAGSTVTKDIPAWSVAVGSPARVVKKVEEVPPIEETGEKKEGEGVSV